MKNSKILIAEDEMLIALDIEQAVSRIGYTVIDIVPSGEEVLEAATRIRPDLVLMDIVLHGSMSGIDTAKVLYKKMGIPIVFITAYGDDETLERAKETQPFGYLLKPFDERQLAITIEVALYRDELERERNRLLREKDELIRQRDQVLSEIKTLRGMIPICTHCKKIRNDHGFWEQVEKYIKEHSDVEFTHGVCPDCMEKYYKEFND